MLHHPAQIYDALMNVAALGIVLWMERKRLRAGVMAAAFIVLHGITRFIYEFWRAGSEGQVERGEASSTYWGALPITQAQAVAIAMCVVGAILWIVFSRRSEAARVPAQSAPSAPPAPKEIQPV